MYDDAILGAYTCLSSVFYNYFIGTFPNTICLFIKQSRDVLAGARERLNAGNSRRETV